MPHEAYITRTPYRCAGTASRKSSGQLNQIGGHMIAHGTLAQTGRARQTVFRGFDVIQCQ